jgi:NADPH-dependent curcumin reductase CurA
MRSHAGFTAKTNLSDDTFSAKGNQMITNRQVVLKRAPAAMPKAADFEAQSCAMPAGPPADGLLVRVIALSMDPYLGGRLRGRHMGEPAPVPGAKLPGFAVAEVMESAHPGFQPGDHVVTETGWCRYAAVPAAGARKVTPGLAPISAHLGVLGMPGLTAWAGVTQLAKVGPGDVFVVDAAAGAVGGTAGQIARNLGARAVGIAGGAAKAALVTETYGFDACVDYRADGWQARLKAACGAGPTVHFENVGASVLQPIFPMLQNYARLVLCGLAEHYHSDGQPPVLPVGPIVGKRAAIYGLVVYDFYDRLNEWVALATPWIAEGKLIVHEDASEGLDSAPAQFERMLKGQHLGKAIVRVGPDRT